MSASNSIKQFIEDFNLKQPNGVVMFPAKINYNINGHARQRYSEVHIVTSNNLDTIYLLNKDLRFEELPDIFKASSESFRYVDNKYLLIKTKDSGNFIELFPIVVEEAG